MNHDLSALLASLILVFSKNEASIQNHDKSVIESAVMEELNRSGHLQTIRQYERHIHKAAEDEVLGLVGPEAAKVAIPVLYAGKAYVDGVLITKTDIGRIHLSKDRVEISEVRVGDMSVYFGLQSNTDTKYVGISMPF